MASIPSDCAESRIGLSRRPKVRVVAKIRGFTDQEIEFCNEVSADSWISVHKPKGEASEVVTISFGDQSAGCGRGKESYGLDHCYEKNEDIDMIFSREIKPMISDVFDGRNATVIACGAKGSGKTYLIQGTNKKLGFAALAMGEILLKAEELGKTVTLSSYEVYQDQIFDSLDPKRPLVSVFEDAQGKIQLKGLSEVSVKSISEFQNLQKSIQKLAGLTRRVHKGLIIHVLSQNENADSFLVRKMNFVDLAGYEDARRKSIDSSNFIENAKVNKSLYALQNVVYALNANESHIPYRESKLTRLMQDSLGGTNRILMLTCLNPSFCQDSMYMISLASRSCQVINRTTLDPRKKLKNSTKPTALSACKSRIPMSGSTTVKKKTVSRLNLSDKKAIVIGSKMKGRKLFSETSHLTKSEKKRALSVALKEMEATLITEKEIMKAALPLEEENSFSLAPNDKEDTVIVEKETSSFEVPDAPIDQIKDDFMHNEDDNLEEVTPCINGSTKALSFAEGHNLDKENNGSCVNNAGSPPISVRLRELSNNLKALYTSTPLRINMSQENHAPISVEFSTDIIEPKTPAIYKNGVTDKLEAITNSPWETFNMRSTGMKNSLVEEFLKFLNTATKEELKGLKGIGDKRATYILQLREESSDPFKNLDDLKSIGLSSKQVKELMRKIAGDLFH